jgi:ADP-ribose pyrophosphatase YjhB (NUDIX family)
MVKFSMNIDLSSHGVVAVIIKNDKFLMIKEAQKLLNGHWGPPHGVCGPEDVNEEATIIRKTKSETGLEVIPIKKITTAPADTKVKTISFWLTEMPGEQNIVLDEAVASEYGWFTVDEALKLPLYPGTKKFFENIDSYHLM